MVELPHDVLISEAKSRSYDGLWLREPKQFLHDAMPRAERYLERIILNSGRTATDSALGSPLMETRRAAAGRR